MANEPLPTAELVASIKRGQRVVARGEEIGEVVEVTDQDRAPFMHIQRYGPGLDQIYVPITAVERVVGNEVFLRLSALDLVAEPWHEKPKTGL